MALDPAGLVAWLAAGLFAGFLASHFVRGHGYGPLGDSIAGILGAFVGGGLASLLGFGGAEGFGGTIVGAFIGAAVLLAVVRAVAPRRRFGL
jgi:uncharacterized membrane protein YeaQ/YmgE (transglycosylase-associated protein family)